MRLVSQQESLNEALGGGLPTRCLIEWGMPMGSEARTLLFPFLKTATRENYILWIHGHKDMNIYPPVFFAHGVNAERCVFAKSLDIFRELKSAFLSPLFKVIVIDTPQFVQLEECLFLTRCARKNKQSIVLLRPYFLSNKKGNIACKTRINSWKEASADRWYINTIKGQDSQQSNYILTGEQLCS